MNIGSVTFNIFFEKWNDKYIEYVELVAMLLFLEIIHFL